MVKDRRRLAVAVMALVLAGSLYWTLSGGGGGTPVASRAAPRTGRGPAQTGVPRIGLERLDSQAPEAGVGQRDIFDFGEAPPTPPPVEPPPGEPSPGPVTEPAASAELERFLLEEGMRHQAIQLNREAALQKRLLADGFVPTSNEFSATLAGIDYIAQQAEHLARGERRVYYVQAGDWNNVRFAQAAPIGPSHQARGTRNEK